MTILSRYAFREILASALLGAVLFTFVLFLQRMSPLFGLLVRSTASASTVGYLFLLVLPRTLPFTIPVGLLVGVLIGLSRMAGDGEITAMRAAGISSRRLLTPVLTLSLLAMAGTAYSSLVLTPASIRETYRVINRLSAAQMTAEVQPRVFEEQFPKTVLYVGDVIPGPVVRWRNVFMADLRPPEERASNAAREAGDGPRITVAAEAIAVADTARNRIQLELHDASAHEAGKDASQYYRVSYPRSDQVLEAERPGEIRARTYIDMDTQPLLVEARNSVEAAIELHQRLALPPACVLLAMVGVPIGVSSRKGGKSAAVVVTVMIAFLYYMGLISLVGLARQATVPVAVAVWAPNAALALVGAILLFRLETPGDRDLIGWLARHWQALREYLPRTQTANGAPGTLRFRLPLMPQIIDAYVLSGFLFYFFLLLTSFVLMTHVFNFFELLGDVFRNSIPMTRVLTYHVFLTPKLLYDSTPVSVLVAVLMTFGILTKNNEITAFKACGVSLYRLAAPVLLTSLMLSGALFAFDHYVVPGANLIQDAIRNEIKGRPVQTYLRPDRKWIRGQGSRIYYYRLFDPSQNIMVGVSVYELETSPFRLKRHISAERARWEPAMKSWIFQDGWTRDLDTNRERYATFEATTFRELTEPPDYFLKEVKQEKQMNFVELAAYMRELQQSGLDTVRMQVQFHKKFSLPLFALIMAMIAVPFSFIAGARGAMSGVGLSIGVAMSYFAVNHLFEQVGNLNQLPPAVAAWSPDVIFSLAGLYLLARMRS